MLKTKITMLAVIASIFCCTQSSAQDSHQEFKEWPALDTFHKVISNTFHQSEESNFKPIRERSSELHDKAVKLAASKIPADLNRSDVRKAVKELEKETDQLNKLVKKNASDEELRQMLITIHETFHKIAELCPNGEQDQK